MIQKLGKVAIVRLLVMGVGLIALFFLMQVVPRLMIPLLPMGARGKWINPTAALLLAAVMIAGYHGLVRWLEKRRADELSAGPSLRLVPLGMLTGLGLFCVVYAVLWASGHLVWGGF